MLNETNFYSPISSNDSYAVIGLGSSNEKYGNNPISYNTMFVIDIKRLIPFECVGTKSLSGKFIGTSLPILKDYNNTTDIIYWGVHNGSEQINLSENDYRKYFNIYYLGVFVDIDGFKHPIFYNTKNNKFYCAIKVTTEYKLTEVNSLIQLFISYLPIEMIYNIYNKNDEQPQLHIIEANGTIVNYHNVKYTLGSKEGMIISDPSQYNKTIIEIKNDKYKSKNSYIHRDKPYFDVDMVMKPLKDKFTKERLINKNKNNNFDNLDVTLLV